MADLTVKSVEDLAKGLFKAYEEPEPWDTSNYPLRDWHRKRAQELIDDGVVMLAADVWDEGASAAFRAIWDGEPTNPYPRPNND